MEHRKEYALVGRMMRAETTEEVPDDARRIIGEHRMKLQVAIYDQEERQGVEARIRQVMRATSGQGRAQLASLNDELHRLPDEAQLRDVAWEAARVLNRLSPETPEHPPCPCGRCVTGKTILH